MLTLWITPDARDLLDFLQEYERVRVAREQKLLKVSLSRYASQDPLIRRILKRFRKSIVDYAYD